MTTEITNTADIIDSRDIIERIEELEAERKPWVAGYNMPGYMPDNEPASFETWEEAKAYLVETVKTFADEDNIELIDEPFANWSEDQDVGEIVGQFHYWITAADCEGLSDDDHAELMALRKLAEQCDGCSDWQYGETLIRRSYWVKYIEQLIDDCYEMPKPLKSDQWPYRHMTIDYKAAADEAEVDYISVDFDGVEYLIRSV